MADNQGRITRKDSPDRGSQNHSAFIQSVKTVLASAKDKTARIRRTGSQLFLVSVISPAAATLISALAAAIGGNEMFRLAAAQAEDGGWRLACILVAIFGFIATVSEVIKKQFEDRLTLGNQCVGRLLALDLALSTGGIDWDDAAKEYSEILKTFPEFIS